MRGARGTATESCAARRPGKRENLVGFNLFDLKARTRCWSLLSDSVPNLIRTSVCDEYSLSAKVTAQLDHMSSVKQRLVQIGRMDGPAEQLS